MYSEIGKRIEALKGRVAAEHQRRRVEEIRTAPSIEDLDIPKICEGLEGLDWGKLTDVQFPVLQDFLELVQTVASAGESCTDDRIRVRDDWEFVHGIGIDFPSG